MGDLSGDFKDIQMQEAMLTIPADSADSMTAKHIIINQGFINKMNAEVIITLKPHEDMYVVINDVPMAL